MLCRTFGFVVIVWHRGRVRSMSLERHCMWTDLSADLFFSTTVWRAIIASRHSYGEAFVSNSLRKPFAICWVLRIALIVSSRSKVLLSSFIFQMMPSHWVCRAAFSHRKERRICTLRNLVNMFKVQIFSQKIFGILKSHQFGVCISEFSINAVTYIRKWWSGHFVDHDGRGVMAWLLSGFLGVPALAFRALGVSVSADIPAVDTEDRWSSLREKPMRWPWEPWDLEGLQFGLFSRDHRRRGLK